jgi:hypothetical protein
MRHKEDEDDANSRERRGGTAIGEPHAWRCWEELTPGEGRQRKMCRNLERVGQAGLTMMPAFKTPSRILSSVKTFP